MEEGKIELEVTAEEEGKRLDKLLAERFPERFSRSFLQRLITSSNVLLNGIAAKNHHRVKYKDAISITVPEPVLSSITPEDIRLDIVYEDGSLLVVNKPRGMVVHPAPGNYSGTLVNALIAHCGALSGVGGVARPGVVHRIDKDASGLLVVAKNDRVHKSLSKQFKAKVAKRIYIALVKGIVQLDNGVIELPIGRSERDRKKMAVGSRSSKAAVTRYKVLERLPDSTLLEVTLGTGRTHQIRVHMAYVGHPVIGDDKYGARPREGEPLALHARTLGFTHPETGKYSEFTSDIPDDMKGLIEKRRNAAKKNRTGK